MQNNAASKCLKEIDYMIFFSLKHAPLLFSVPLNLIKIDLKKKKKKKKNENPDCEPPVEK